MEYDLKRRKTRMCRLCAAFDHGLADRKCSIMPANSHGYPSGTLARNIYDHPRLRAPFTDDAEYLQTQRSLECTACAAYDKGVKDKDAREIEKHADMARMRGYIEGSFPEWMYFYGLNF